MGRRGLRAFCSASACSSLAGRDPALGHATSTRPASQPLLRAWPPVLLCSSVRAARADAATPPPRDWCDRGRGAFAALLLNSTCGRPRSRGLWLAPVAARAPRGGGHPLEVSRHWQPRHRAAPYFRMLAGRSPTRRRPKLSRARTRPISSAAPTSRLPAPRRTALAARRGLAMARGAAQAAFASAHAFAVTTASLTGAPSAAHYGHLRRQYSVLIAARSSRGCCARGRGPERSAPVAKIEAVRLRGGRCLIGA